jgi:hypothetical protein
MAEPTYGVDSSDGWRTSADGLTRTRIAPDAAAPMVPSQCVTLIVGADGRLKPVDGSGVAPTPVPNLAEGFDGSSVRAGPNHSTIEIWYDTHEQAVAAHKFFNDLVDAAAGVETVDAPNFDEAWNRIKQEHPEASDFQDFVRIGWHARDGVGVGVASASDETQQSSADGQLSMSDGAGKP